MKNEKVKGLTRGEFLRRLDDIERRLQTLGRKLDAYEARAKERKVTGGATFVVG